MTTISKIITTVTLFTSLVFANHPESLGTVAPPSEYEGYLMTNILDDRTELSMVSDLPTPWGNSLGFSPDVSHRTVGSSWGTWSHDYTGSLYFTEYASELDMTFPDNVCALIFYLEPNNFATFNFNVSYSDGWFIDLNIDGFAGATGFAVSLHDEHGFPTGVNILNTDGAAAGFAVGEFSMSQCTETGLYPHVGVLASDFDGELEDIPDAIGKVFVADGECDNGEINLAMQYVAPGGTLWLSPGSFQLCDSIVLDRDDITLRGAENPVVYTVGDGTFHMIKVYERKTVTIMDMTLFGHYLSTEGNYLGVDVKTSEYVQMKQLCLLFFSHYGFRVEESQDINMNKLKIVGNVGDLAGTRRRLKELEEESIWDSIKKRLSGSRRLQEEEEESFEGNGGKVKSTKNFVLKNSLFLLIPDYGLRFHSNSGNENVWLINNVFFKIGRVDTENIRSEYVKNMNLISSTFINCEHALKSKHGDGFSAVANRILCQQSGLRVEGTEGTLVLSNGMIDLEGESGTVLNLLPKPGTDDCKGGEVRMNTVCTLVTEDRPFKMCDESELENNEVFKYADNVDECFYPFDEEEEEGDIPSV